MVKKGFQELVAWSVWHDRKAESGRDEKRDGSRQREKRRQTDVVAAVVSVLFLRFVVSHDVTMSTFFISS